MGVMDLLSRLDAQVLPRLASGLRRVRRSVGGHGPTRPLPLATLALVVAVLATAVWQLGEPAPAGLGPGSTIRVGVGDGDLIGDYVAASRAELTWLAAQDRQLPQQRPVYALVSLAEYLSPAGVTALIASAAGTVEPIAAYARVPVPRRQTELVRLPAQRLPGDVVAGMAHVGERKERDTAIFAELARSEPGPQLRALYESNASVARVEALAYRNRCACVYALVVRATAAALAGLDDRAPVRVVDAAPEVIDIGRTVFVALLPEQVGRVEPPADDGIIPAPAASGPAPAETG